jgi:serine protease
MDTPNPSVVVEGVQTMDLAATDAVSAWGITTGSTGIVIADVDTGVRFDHPDLLRAGLGGRLLPGYDFVGEDYDPNTGAPLGTYLEANDGDGWDPDPSDPGDWISSTDQQNSVFPAADCPVANSSWHGTRVVGIFGALTNNDLGIAAMSWGPWVLPVRALGKCGGYDSDIIAAIEWAAGLPVSGTVPANPYPADIINLSLGGSSTCPSDYQDALATVTNMGVLIVASAGNSTTAVTGTSSVEAPANCSATVSGMIAVAGLRNTGTKVGYSSLGPEVGVAAPAGNCINTSGDCLRSIDTTTNLGTTTPGANSYTNETNVNLGTSFSAPIVSGIAALMRSVNGNLTPAQLVTRIKASASAFPANSGNIPVCPSLASNGECSCPPSGQCGDGMVNAYQAVQSAQNPIAAVALPSTIAAGGSVFDGSGSAASCNRSIVAYSWAASGSASIASGASAARAMILPGSGAGTVTLTVTDSMGATDAATISIASATPTSTAPATAGATACPSALSVTPAGPAVTQAFSPTSIVQTFASTLTITLSNSNKFDLTQTQFSDTLPSGLTLASSPAPSTTCTATGYSLTVASNTVTLTGADVPPQQSCTITLAVSATAAGSYLNTIAANAVTSGPAGGNPAPSTAALLVTAPYPPAVTEAFSPANTTPNGVSNLAITLSNANGFALTGTGLTDTLPANLAIQASAPPVNGCGGTLSTTSTGATLAGATVAANGSCTITIPVSSATSGSYANIIAANAVSSTPATGASAAASAVLIVAVPAPPTVTEAFAPASIAPNDTSALTITLGNANTFALTGAALTDTLPANLTMAATPAGTSGCGGTLSTTATSATLAGAALPANATCTITFTVTAATAGSYTNTLGAGAVTTPTGGNTAAASATLTVTATQSSGSSGGAGSGTGSTTVGGSSSSAHGGGGSAHWLELLFLATVVLSTRRSSLRVNRRNQCRGVIWAVKTYHIRPD